MILLVVEHVGEHEGEHAGGKVAKSAYELAAAAKAPSPPSFWAVAWHR